MGANFARDLAEAESLTLEQQLYYHLRSNFFPPIPGSMVQPCLDAIDAFYDDALDRAIALPEGITYKGNAYAPAGALLEQHRLDPWLEYED